MSSITNTDQLFTTLVPQLPGETETFNRGCSSFFGEAERTCRPPNGLFAVGISTDNRCVGDSVACQKLNQDKCLITTSNGETINSPNVAWNIPGEKVTLTDFERIKPTFKNVNCQYKVSDFDTNEKVELLRDKIITSNEQLGELGKVALDTNNPFYTRVLEFYCTLPSEENSSDINGTKLVNAPVCQQWRQNDLKAYSLAGISYCRSNTEEACNCINRSVENLIPKGLGSSEPQCWYPPCQNSENFIIPEDILNSQANCNVTICNTVAKFYARENINVNRFIQDVNCLGPNNRELPKQSNGLPVGVSYSGSAQNKGSKFEDHVNDPINKTVILISSLVIGITILLVVFIFAFKRKRK